MSKRPRLNDWYAPWWKQVPHGTAWDKVKGDLERTWNRPLQSFGERDAEKSVDVADSIKAVSEALKAVAETINETARNILQAAEDLKTHAHHAVDAPRRRWKDVEPAVRYGFGASLEYGNVFTRWDDTLDAKLATEWNEKETGEPFKEVEQWVQRGWHTKP